MEGSGSACGFFSAKRLDPASNAETQWERTLSASAAAETPAACVASYDECRYARQPYSSGHKKTGRVVNAAGFLVVVTSGAFHAAS